MWPNAGTREGIRRVHHSDDISVGEIRSGSMVRFRLFFTLFGI